MKNKHYFHIFFYFSMMQLSMGVLLITVKLSKFSFLHRSFLLNIDNYQFDDRHSCRTKSSFPGTP